MAADHRRNNGAERKMHRSVQEDSLVRSTSAVDTPPISAETIAAISTPAGEGAIALVRMSGSDAIAIADTLFRGKESPSRCLSHVQRLGKIVNKAEELIDEVLLCVHRAPASYTGEDLVEISCHGGSLLTAKVLEAFLRAAALPARSWEFTECAFLIGKMYITQPEHAWDLIS